MSRDRLIALMALTILTAAVGCGGRDMANVHGQVTYRGGPVTSGTLVFSPIPANEKMEPGKSATGDIQPDGRFQLSTHRLHDGAIVGRHRVRYVRSLEDDERKTDSAARAVTTYANLTLPDDLEVDVLSGQDNEINIELVKRAPN